MSARIGIKKIPNLQSLLQNEHTPCRRFTLLELIDKPCGTATNESFDGLLTGLTFYQFLLDQVAASGDPDDVALELDWYRDWSINDNFIMSFVAALAEPGDAVEASSGRTETFIYGMIFAAYSF